MEFLSLKGIPSKRIVKDICDLHREVFNEDRQLNERMAHKPNLDVQLAYEDETLIGYKLGYEQNATTFYSWLGGVRSTSQGKGVALQLMKNQHTKAKEAGYEKVETKSMNRWRKMLLLNIRFGFDVTAVEENETGDSKIILQKVL
ncbi:MULTISPECIES: GNAT family N-acetyltransferase [Shouchella]|uniref:GNAT family N-acetyltransferase n=2 Tax=Shouchella TaxID=2893057 RepID=A0ABY7WAS1_9BACI|nr:MULTISPECIES: GNAT family N-acetyltransferase [Shouchella]MED4128774.1 GNAT family N-acetyltransferase [Shouchella miscanthi]WDF05793.1 GNAT family N-acetyltransferase [Shouchella hunanensis]GAF20442.1 acetyltransferase, GNAT family [Bacillus sp. JCM 19047]